MKTFDIDNYDYDAVREWAIEHNIEIYSNLPSPSSEFKTDVVFANEEDATAFKLRFQERNEKSNNRC
jgi:hypothetical protein